MTDMKRPDAGSRYTAHSTPPDTLNTKQTRMAPLMTATTACHRHRVSIHAPRNRPAARSAKEDRDGVRRQRLARPEYPASSVGIHT